MLVVRRDVVSTTGIRNRLHVFIERYLILICRGSSCVGWVWVGGCA